ELQQMVLHDVAQRPNRVIETTPGPYAEVLGHGDLHALDVVAVPQRLEDGVGEPEKQDAQGRFLAEEMVNAQDLPLVEEIAQFGVQGPGRRQVVAERLFHHHPAPLDQAGAGQALNHAAEQRRRALQIKDGAAPPLDGPGDPLIDLWVPEIAREHRQTLRETPEHLFVEYLAAVRNRATGMIAQGGG